MVCELLVPMAYQIDHLRSWKVSYVWQTPVQATGEIQVCCNSSLAIQREFVHV
jgi:hypothetical protein